MDILIGIICGLIIILCGKLTGFENNCSFYPNILIVIGLLYVLFAIVDGRTKVIVYESLFALAFVGIAVLGFKKRLLIAAIGIFMQGIFDIFHNFMIENSGVPDFYPRFCLAVDFVPAIYLGSVQIINSRRH